MTIHDDDIRPDAAVDGPRLPVQVGAIEEAISNTPSDIGQRLARAAAAVARRIVQKPEVIRALAAVDLVPPGIVITGETDAVALADAARTIIIGEKAIASDMAAILRIPKAMEAAVRAAVGDELQRLTAAKARANGAREAYQVQLRRDAARDEAKARERAQKAVDAAAARGEEVGPPVEVAPVVVPRTVAGGIGKTGMSVRVEPAEIVDVLKVPAEWLTLNTAMARSAFLYDEKAGRVRRADPGEAVVWKGVRFASKESAVNR